MGKGIKETDLGEVRKEAGLSEERKKLSWVRIKNQRWRKGGTK